MSLIVLLAIAAVLIVLGGYATYRIECPVPRDTTHTFGET
jgi:hypothetical protein